MIENAQSLLEHFNEYQICLLPQDVQEEVTMLRLKSETDDDGLGSQKQAASRNHEQPLHDIFLFREGSVVFWGVPYDRQKRLLSGLNSLIVNPNSTDLIQEERENMSYSLSDQTKSKLVRDTIQINTKQDISSRQLDQFAFSHAIALSVKLGVLEMTLDSYIDSVEWISKNMEAGKHIRLTKNQVLKKTGEVLRLKHTVNLRSDFLDLPDIYWDRNDQEDMFVSMSNYLNIKKRTIVINDRLEKCCELMNFLVNLVNDRHHVKLSWIIIILIAGECIFTFLKFTDH